MQFNIGRCGKLSTAMGLIISALVASEVSKERKKKQEKEKKEGAAKREGRDANELPTSAAGSLSATLIDSDVAL